MSKKPAFQVVQPQVSIDLDVECEGLLIGVTLRNGRKCTALIGSELSRKIAQRILDVCPHTPPEPRIPINREPLYTRSLDGRLVWVFLVDGSTSLVSSQRSGFFLHWVMNHRLMPWIAP